MVEVENLCFWYSPDSPVFHNFNCRIERGERWSVIGSSGCGKTTLLYLLAGLLLPASGSINMEGNPLVKPRLSTGLILQDYGLLPWATVFDNIALGFKIRQAEKRMMVNTTNEWLDRLGIRAEADRYPAELSGGQRQRVAIARTLALEPSLLLMDEPFASLDAFTREDLQDLTLILWEKVTSTIMLVTHNIQEATLLGKRIMVLNTPPNREPVIIENPDSGYPEYRNSPDFFRKCAQLRELIKPDSGNSHFDGSGDAS